MRLGTPTAVLNYAFLCAMSAGLSACASGSNASPASPPAAQSPQLTIGTPVQLAPGGKAVLPDGSVLTFQSVVNDSRCKPGVQCVWAGDAETRFTHTTRAGRNTIFSLHTQLQPRSKTLGASTLHLLDVDWNTPPGVRVELK